MMTQTYHGSDSKIQCEYNPARLGNKREQVNSGLDQAIKTSVKAA